MKLLSCVQFFGTPWTVAHHTPPSMEFSRQECWRGSPFPSPGDLPDPGIEPRSPALQAHALPSEPPRKPNVSVGFHKCLYFLSESAELVGRTRGSAQQDARALSTRGPAVRSSFRLAEGQASLKQAPPLLTSTPEGVCAGDGGILGATALDGWPSGQASCPKGSRCGWVGGSGPQEALGGWPAGVTLQPGWVPAPRTQPTGPAGLRAFGSHCVKPPLAPPHSSNHKAALQSVSTPETETHFESDF